MTQKMTPHINSWQTPDSQSLIIKTENKRELKRVPFTAEMKQTHTILVPMMLPVHFELLVKILHLHGYNAELLHNDGKGVVDEGLRNVHNDTCYPALLVIGQMIDALKSGKWDLQKVALLITQTGGGCRASNYIYLLRKALNKAGFGNIPVISLNFSGLEADQGFSVTRPMLQNLLNAIVYGDLIMHIANQCRPYEKNKGDTDAMVDKWVRRITSEGTNEGLRKYSALKKDMKLILDDFASIPRDTKQKVRVGIVGEIYIKFSPLGNNNLEDFLLAEDCEVVIPGFMDFCLYCINDTIVGGKMYGGTLMQALIYRVVYCFLQANKLIQLKPLKSTVYLEHPLRLNTRKKRCKAMSLKV